jgi:hypothetical protein
LTSRSSSRRSKVAAAPSRYAAPTFRLPVRRGVSGAKFHPVPRWDGPEYRPHVEYEGKYTRHLDLRLD